MRFYVVLHNNVYPNLTSYNFVSSIFLETTILNYIYDLYTKSRFKGMCMACAKTVVMAIWFSYCKLKLNQNETIEFKQNL